MFIIPFHRFPQPLQFVLHINENNAWFCIIEYPSNGTFESDFDDVDVRSNFVCFLIFCCDGKDEPVEDLERVDVVVCVVDMLFDCKDDVSIRIFWMFRFDFFRLLHLVLIFFYYNKNNYQIKFFSFYIELVATFNNFR